MWGIIPAAGSGSRIQPLAFSKELLPVGSRLSDGAERPCAVSEYLCERMVDGGANKLCFVIAPGKSDIMEYYGAEYAGAPIAYVVQPEPRGLCDAIFRVASLITPDEHVLVGLPDTIWMPADGYSSLPDDTLSFLLFPVERPSAFDAVVTDEAGHVQEIQVKQEFPSTNWVWGGFKMPGRILHALQALWIERGRTDEYMGTLVNAYLARGGSAVGVKAGLAYVDVGTLEGYRSANELLREAANENARIAGVHVTAGAPAGRRPLAPRREISVSLK
ncbi:nucleotidyltransferase family protein [Chelativorans sp. YIM 93263]|uniref:nucleotidyltransferase family protein n=1 Tax=Chelativorans sp. YIM 93263 TaxID=2906648 RepID=UPI0023796100|nr:nucleotidyltransferase family protein [Chelativorans sp. YIM 93263]